MLYASEGGIIPESRLKIKAPKTSYIITNNITKNSKEIFKADINTKIINNQINKRNINPIRTRTPFHEENKSNPLEMQNSSMESRRTNYNRK